MRRLPIPRPGEVLGLVGTNGIGKSTALKILAGKQKPNLGKYDVSTTTTFLQSSCSACKNEIFALLLLQKKTHLQFQSPPDWQEILTYFRGSELQNYFTKILEDDLRAIVKPQYVDQIPKTVKVTEMGESRFVVVARSVVIAYLCLQGSVGAILTRKDDTSTQDIICQQLGQKKTCTYLKTLKYLKHCPNNQV